MKAPPNKPNKNNLRQSALRKVATDQQQKRTLKV